MTGKFFDQEVYIRIAEDQTAFVCTIRYGKLYSKVTEFPLKHEPIPDVVDEKALVLARKSTARRSTAL